MLKRALFLILISLIGLVCLTYPKGTVTVAFLDLANTFIPVQNFKQGFILPSSQGSITVTAPANVNSYTLQLPSSGGQTGYYLCVGNAATGLSLLAHCPSSGPGTALLASTPTSLNFGTVSVHSSAISSLLLTNVGNATLTFTGSAFTFTGDAEYSISTFRTSTCANNGSLIAGATCVLFLQFAPTAVGTPTATLNASSNATGSPLAVSLTGAGQ